MCDRIVTCAYCGQEYPDGTPTSQDESLQKLFSSPICPYCATVLDNGKCPNCLVEFGKDD